MGYKYKYRLLILVILFNCWVSFGNALTSFDLESGLVYNSMNDVGIPGDTGTRFSLTNDLSTNAEPFIRLKIIQSFGERHTVSVLYAPLTVKSSGKLTRPIDFAGVHFLANDNVKGTYMFNSYRLTYRYDFLKTPTNEFGMGLTAKIRDAKIGLKAGTLSGEKSNIGFVPIINFRYKHNFTDQFALMCDGDALGAPQGRAEDILLAGIYKMNNKVSLKAGYRILEGGSDNDEVYGFALFNYVVLGVMINF